MQEKMIDGSYGEPVPFDEKRMGTMLQDPNVEHVEVFNASKKEMHRRKQLFEQSNAAKRKDRKQKNKLQGRSRRNNR